MILANRVRGVDVKKVRKGAMWVSGGTGRQADDTANAKALRQQGWLASKNKTVAEWGSARGEGGELVRQEGVYVGGRVPRHIGSHKGCVFFSRVRSHWRVCNRGVT